MDAFPNMDLTHDARQTRDKGREPSFTRGASAAQLTSRHHLAYAGASLLPPHFKSIARAIKVSGPDDPASVLAGRPAIDPGMGMAPSTPLDVFSNLTASPRAHPA